MKIDTKLTIVLLSMIAAIIIALVLAIKHDMDNTNHSATVLRGQSLCERSNSSTEEVLVGQVYRAGRVDSYTLSTVRCADKATGEIVAKEFKSVLYREKETPQ